VNTRRSRARIATGRFVCALLIIGARMGESASPAAADVTDALQPGGPTWTALARAEDALVGRCMRSHGFEWRDTGDDASSDIPDCRDAARDDVVRARAVGFGLFDLFGALTEPGMERDGPQTRYERALMPEQRARLERALVGRPGTLAEIVLTGGERIGLHTDGCYAKARRKLYGTFKGFVAATQESQSLAVAIERDAVADLRYERAVGSWRQCMGRRKYAYASPTDAEVSVATRYQLEGRTDHMRALEIRTAIDTARCSHAADLRGTMAALRVEHASLLSTEQRQLLTKIARITASALRRARMLTRYAPSATPACFESA